MTRRTGPTVANLLTALTLLLGTLQLGGCTTQARRMDRLALSSGMVVLTLPAGDDLLRGYARPSRSAGGDRLHVYLEGDGRPWIAGGTRVAADPHGEHHLAFELMRLDPSTSIYLKRPCYQSLGAAAAAQRRCSPVLWTHQRYSETVVAALEAALRAYLDDHPANEIVWLGYSGGGVLAMLLAPRFAQTTHVVTVAANLDVAAWARHHGYTPLVGSLDPARRPPLPAHVRQLHLVGELDTNVPPDLVRAATSKQPGSEVRILEGFDHVCCWRDVWPAVLAELK